jgi:hypothetical protein
VEEEEVEKEEGGGRRRTSVAVVAPVRVGTERERAMGREREWRKNLEGETRAVEYLTGFGREAGEAE